MNRINAVIAAVIVAAIGIAVWLGVKAISGPSDGPKVTEAKKLMAVATDDRQASSMRDKAGPQEVQCDRTTRSLRFFDSNSAEPKIWYSTDVTTGHISCWDRDGFDPYTGESLNPVIDKGTGSNGIRGQIINQLPLPKYQRMLPTPPPTQAVAPSEPPARDRKQSREPNQYACNSDGCGGSGPVRTQQDRVANDCGPSGCWGPSRTQMDPP